MTPLASVLVPTHNHASTLPLAVRSALSQTVHDVEVLIIGDGVTPEVRAAAQKLVADDARVRFFDHPKGESHGETYRDTAIHDAHGDAIFYLCDDDLFMPDHVADLLELLATHNFVQCKNGFFTPEGQVLPYAGDLADARLIAAAQLDDPEYNFVSITGTAHSRAFYLKLRRPWTATPAGIWPDLYQWRKMWQSPAFSGATSDRMTALQFPSSFADRETWTQEQRVAELRAWAEIASSPTGQERVDRLVAEGDRLTILNLFWHIWAQAAQLGQQGEVTSQQQEAIDELRRWKARRGQIAADRLSRFVYRLPFVRSAPKPTPTPTETPTPTPTDE
jgi:hypothetical protein